MQFQVPQFIEVEDKIIGPFTIKQFFYLLGGAGGSYLLWVFLPSFLAVIFIIPVAGLALALAFYKVNNRPFINTLQAALMYFLKGNLYIRSKKAVGVPRDTFEMPAPAVQKPVEIPKMTQSKLKDLAWSLDVQEKIKQ